MSDSIDDYYREQREHALANEPPEAPQAAQPPQAPAPPEASEAAGASPPPATPQGGAAPDSAPAAPSPAQSAATYEQAQREHAERRGMYCLGCGRDLTGRAAGMCPDCGRRFDPYQPGTFTIHPPQEPTWLESHERAPAAIWLVSLYLLGHVLGYLIIRFVFAGLWMVAVVYPFWMGLIVWQVLRLIKNDRVSGLAFNLPAGALAGGVLGIPDGGFAVLTGITIGALMGLLYEYVELARTAG